MLSNCLGAPVCISYTCICGEAVDASGTRSLRCCQSAGRHTRHSAVIDIISRALASAAVPARLELLSLLGDDGKQGDGLSTEPWKNVWCPVCACPDTLAVSHLDWAVSGPQQAVWPWRLKHGSAWTTVNSFWASYYFVLVGINTVGVLSDLDRCIAAMAREQWSAYNTWLCSLL